MKNYILIFILCLIVLVSNAHTANDYYMKGVKKSQSNDYRGAIEDYTKAIELDPIWGGIVTCYSNRGACKSLLTDYRGAIKDFTKAIELFPDIKHYERRAFNKYLVKDFQGAIEDFTKVIKLDTTCFICFSTRADCKFSIGDFRGAIVDFTKAIELEPDNDGILTCYWTRGKCNDNIKDYRGAIEDYTKAIKLKPDYSDLYINRAFTKLDLGLKNSGCLDFSKAGELGDKNAIWYIKEYCK